MTESHFQHVEPCLDQDILILTVKLSELRDDTTTDKLRDEMVEAASTSGVKLAILDFHQTHFIASPGIRALLSFRRSFVEQGGRLIVCHLNDLIRDVLSTARLIGTTGCSPPVLFETAPDRAAGMAYLKTPRAEQ
jgi:anti-anti-sigma factor